MSGNMDEFFGKDEPEAEVAPAPAIPAEPEAQQTKPADKAAEPDDDTIPEPVDGDRTVPLKAFEAVRGERKDWKEKAVRSEGVIAELQRQLEEARKPQPAPVPQNAPQPINPVDDPQGFTARVQEVAISNKLDMSEMMLREKIGSEAVDAVIAEFKAAATANPALFAQLYQQPHPYAWAHQQVEAMRLQREIGSDPAAYKARLLAEERAKWEAERNAQPAAAEPTRPVLPSTPSLARAPSAAQRGAVVDNVPETLAEIFGR